MKAKRVLLGVFLATAMLAVIGGVAYTQTGAAGSQSETTNAAEESTAAAENGDNAVRGSISAQELAKIDEAAAERAALKAVPGTVEEIDLETDDKGYLVYSVEVAGDDGQAHDLIVDAGNGEILHRENETQDLEEDGSYRGSISVQELATVDEAAAERAALKAVPGTVEEIGVEMENGYLVYSVEVTGDDGQAHDLTVDAGNGEVLYQDVEDSD